VDSETAAAFSLLNAQAVRDRAQRMLAIGLDGKLPNFRVDLGRLDAAVDLVIDTTRQTYPTLAVPLHSRWRHFVVAGEDRWALIDKSTNWRDPSARARAACDLAIVSVLLDAGAGPQWRYRTSATMESVGRSEGLALASLDMFCRGTFSSDPGNRLQADPQGLMQLSDDVLANGFQVSSSNPLVGIGGRADLLRRLGAVVAARPEIFGREDKARPGGLFDHFAALLENRAIPAARILSELLHHLGPVWPSRLTLGGVPLGDSWRHPSLRTADATSEIVPLHKLSQWLAYSLIEPLQWAGISVTEVDGLTGLAEYRNGGLFIDTGVLAFRDPADAMREHDVAGALVVEWRTLTVALLDKLADAMRRRLGMDQESLPLGKVLQGGTWAAGRIIAHKRRSNGAPPIKVASDGTVF
jgi:Protein of unknown function (DUF1688)